MLDFKLKFHALTLKYKGDCPDEGYCSGKTETRVHRSIPFSDSDPHRDFDPPFLTSPTFLRGCKSSGIDCAILVQWRVIGGNWKRRRPANGKGDFLPGQVNLKTPHGASLPRHAIPCRFDGLYRERKV